MSFLAGPAFSAHPSEMAQFVPFANAFVKKDKKPSTKAPKAATPTRAAVAIPPRSSSHEAPAYSPYPPRTSSVASPPPPYRATPSSAEFEQQLTHRTDERVAGELRAFGL